MEAGIAVRGLRARVESARRSDAAPAAGLAVATIFQQLIAVVFTVVFTKILGRDGYGSLAALIALLVILIVPGSALQVAAARQGTLGRFGSGEQLAATLDRWTRHLLAGIAAVAAVAILLRAPLAELIGIDEQWAAAAAPISAAVWLLVSVQRGLLQAARAYRPVALSFIADGLGRLLFALALVAVSLDVTGAFLAQLASWSVIAIVLHRELRQRVGPARTHPQVTPLSSLARNAAIPITGLIFVAALQNVDVIMARHTLTNEASSDYAAAGIAAKLVVWIAVGIGLWVLPEATRRAAAGLDPRVVLGRALAMIAALAIPSLLIFALVPRLLLRIAFGAKYEAGDQVLLPLGIAFALLAVTYVTVQYLLGLHRRGFVAILGVAAVAEPLALLSADDGRGLAWLVVAVQTVAMVGVLLVAWRVRADPHAHVALD